MGMASSTRHNSDDSSARRHAEPCTRGPSGIPESILSQNTTAPSRSVQEQSPCLSIVDINKQPITGVFLGDRSPRDLQDAANHLWQRQPVCLHSAHLQQELRTALRRPPISQEGLSISNIKALVDGTQLRHDLNFDRSIIFCSVTDKHRLAIARQYYSAIAFELVLFISSSSTRQCQCACTGKPWTEEIRPYLGRLPDFFKAIRNVTRALIRSEHWSLVDQAIDVDLLMNQLENGLCSLLPLTKWLGDILKQSCSPLRDQSVDQTVTTITMAMEIHDANQLAAGLSKLFDVFHTMELDVINHQIRIFLPPKIDESTDFVQDVYQKAFTENQIDYKGIWKWYHEEREYYECKAAKTDYDAYHGENGHFNDGCTFPDEDFLTRYMDIVFHEIVQGETPSNKLPKPFELDTLRIDNIRASLRQLEHRQYQIKALSVILYQCKSNVQPTEHQKQQLLDRLKDIESHPLQASEKLEAVALEIVRTAYLLSNKSGMLDQHLLLLARNLLDSTHKIGSSLRIVVKRNVHSRIEELLGDELSGSNGIEDLLPSQILNRYKPIDMNGQLVAVRDAGDDQLTRDVKFLARSLVHITLIQWRIWAKILWFKAPEAIFESMEEYSDWHRGVQERIDQRLQLLKTDSAVTSASHYQQRHSNPSAQTAQLQPPSGPAHSDVSMAEPQDKYNGSVSLQWR